MIPQMSTKLASFSQIGDPFKNTIFVLISYFVRLFVSFSAAGDELGYETTTKG